MEKWGRDDSLSVFTVVDDGTSISVFGEIGILVRTDLEPFTSVSLSLTLKSQPRAGRREGGRSETYLALSQLVFLWVGRDRYPN